MKATSFLILTLLVIFSACNTQKSEDKTTKSAQIVDIAELLQEPGKFENQKLSVKGLCIHTCRKSGKKLFLQGNTEEEFLKVTAGDNISTFENALEGEEVIVTGVFLAENIGEETHHEKEHEDSCASEKKPQNFFLKCNSFEVTKNGN